MATLEQSRLELAGMPGGEMERVYYFCTNEYQNNLTMNMMNQVSLFYSEVEIEEERRRGEGGRKGGRQ